MDATKITRSPVYIDVERELEIVWQFVVTSYRFAIGYVAAEDATDDVVVSPGTSEGMAS